MKIPLASRQIREQARLVARTMARADDVRFGATAPTLHPRTGENLDLPAYIRRGHPIREIS